MKQGCTTQQACHRRDRLGLGNSWNRYTWVKAGSPKPEEEDHCTMARKPRLPFECYQCGKRWKTSQALFGHLRHHTYLRQRAQAEAEIGAVPQGAAVKNHSGSTLRERLRPSQDGEAEGMRRRPGPLSYEFRTLLLDVELALDQLQQTARHFADLAWELARMNVVGQNARAKAWEQIHHTLDDYLRDLEPMLALFSLDRVAMFRIYHSMRRLKEHWLGQRIGERRCVVMEPDGWDPEFRLELREEQTQLTRIVEYLKQLVAAAP